MLHSRCLRVVTVVVALLTPALPVRAAGAEKYLPDDAAVVVALNVRQIVDSSLVKKHAIDALKKMIDGDAEAAKILKALGFDPFQDLNSVTLALTGLDADSNVHLIAHGKFDAAKISAKGEEAAKEFSDELKIHKEGDRIIYEVNTPGSSKPLFVAQLGADTMVAGTVKDYVLACFDRAAGKKAASLNKDMAELLAKADAKKSVWIGMSGAAISKINLPQPNDRAKKVLERVKSFVLNFSVTKDVKLHLGIDAKSTDSAKELLEEVKEFVDQAKGFLALAVDNQKALTPLLDLVGAIKLTTEGSTVSLTTEVSAEVIEEGLKKTKGK
jgi:hypothetical protein